MLKGGLVELSSSVPLATAWAVYLVGEYGSGGWRGAEGTGKELDR